MTILLTSNSPGEVFSWVRVTVAALQRLAPEVNIQLCLVPCPFASGAEKAVASSIAGLQHTLSPWETTRFLVGLGRPPFQTSGPGLVVFLGGDPWHALLLGRKLGWPTLGYFTRPTDWSRFFDHVAVSRGPERWVRQPVTLVGDLMVDGVQPEPEAQPGLPARPVGPVLGLYPGSRRLHLQAGLGTFLGMIEALAARRSQLRFVLVKSPFVSDQTLARVAARPFSLGLPTASAQLLGETLVTSSGVRLERIVGLPFQVMSQFDVALTIPGTNTAELACAARPFVVPMHPRAYVGGGGLNGLLERLPLGDRVKGRLRQRKQRRLHYVSLPNQLSGRMIAPEVIMSDSTEPVLEQVLALLDQPTEAERIGCELQQVMGAPGASTRLAELILQVLGR